VSTREGTVDATFYAQVDTRWSSYVSHLDGERLVQAARVERITQSRPARPKPGSVVVALTTRLPRAVFYPLQPQAVVVVPDSMTELIPVEVEASDPHAPEEDQEP
jgi:hypothetical protein